VMEEFNIQGKQSSFYKYCPGTFGYTLVTNLVREYSRQPEVINKFAYWVLPKHVGTLTTLFTIGIHIVHCLTLRTHLLITYEVRNMSKRPSFLARICVHSVSKNAYIYLSDSFLAVSGTK